MPQAPFYDPQKSYEDNFADGPFGAFADGTVFSQAGEAQHKFLGLPVFLPFGIAAGPLLNGKFVKAALDKGFDIPVYKTVRTRIYPAHPWPNVLPVEVRGKLMPGGDPLKVAPKVVSDKISITNSFGVPSFNPHFWQKDIADCAAYAKPGQVVVASFQGTTTGDGNVRAYIADFALAARLLKETGVKVLEVNLSCPNEGSSHLLCYDTPTAEKVIEAIKSEIGETPLIIKIAYFEDRNTLRGLLKAIGKKIAAVSAINTIGAKVVDQKGEQALPGKGRLTSGVGGYAIKWAGLEMAQSLKAIREDLGLDFAIIGVGGVLTPADYMEYREAGADAVMSATGAMWNPYLAQEIKGKR